MRLTFIISTLFLILMGHAQNRNTAQNNISLLCADSFAGRGYLDSGDYYSAAFIANQFNKMGLTNINGSYFQSFTLNVNTFPTAKLSIDDQPLIPGYDFLVSPNSASSADGSMDVRYFGSKKLETKRGAKKLNRAINKGYLPVLDKPDTKNVHVSSNLKEMYANQNLKTVAYLKPSMLWSVSQTQQSICELWLVDTIFNRKTKSIFVDVEANFKRNYSTQNVIGKVDGTLYPDSFIIICGHYDHLGRMGEAIFYGANDNASGISMMLDMADYFVTHPQKYSIVFIAFAAEEAGLVGSKYYVENTPNAIPLSNTRFVFNMDLMGNGKNGATVVNSTIFTSEFDLLNRINTTNAYLPVLKTRGKAANSDHYYFTEAGIPSFFLYTEGEYSYYHIPNDNARNLNLGPYYDKTFLLIRDFVIELNK